MALTKEQIKKFKEAEKEAEDSYDYRSVADEIAEAGDKEWAKKIYEESEEKAEDCSHYSDLAERIIEKLDDKEWGKKVYKKAEGKAKENDDIRALAKSLYKNIGDHKWSDNVYKKAPLTKEEIKEFKAAEKDADDSEDFIRAADEIAEAGDKGWAKKVYEKAEKKSKDCSDLESLAASIHEGLCDEEWTKKIYKKAEGKAEDFSEFNNIAKGIAENLANKEWAKKVYEKAEGKAEDFSEFNNIANAIADNLGDKDWAKKIYVKAEKKAEDSKDMKDLGESILVNLVDTKWVKIILKKAVDKINCANETYDVGYFIENSLGDLNWAKNVYTKVLEYKNTDDHITSRLDIGRVFLETYNDDVNANKVLEDAIQHVGEGYYIDIYYFLLDDLKNINKANKWKDKYFDEMKNDYETYGGGEELFEGDGDDDEGEENNEETSRSTRIYIKTEPAGEICAGKLNDNEVANLRELFIKDSLKDSELVECANGIDNIGHTYGVFTSKDGSDLEDIEFDGGNYHIHSTIEIPNNDGFYVVYTGLSKISAEFHFSPEDGEVFDSSKMKFNVTDVKLDMVSDSLYGELEYSVIDGYLYNGKEIEEASEDIYVDRGIDREVTIIFVKNNEQYVIYNIRNESEEKYCVKQLKKLAASLEKTGDKEWAKSLEEKANELEDDY
jgi:hypothetical protein